MSESGMNKVLEVIEPGTRYTCPKLRVRCYTCRRVYVTNQTVAHVVERRHCLKCRNTPTRRRKFQSHQRVAFT